MVNTVDKDKYYQLADNTVIRVGTIPNGVSITWDPNAAMIGRSVGVTPISEAADLLSLPDGTLIGALDRPISPPDNSESSLSSGQPDTPGMPDQQAESNGPESALATYDASLTCADLTAEVARLGRIVDDLLAIITHPQDGTNVPSQSDITT